MWRAELANVNPGEHISQFYQDPRFLRHALGFWLGSGLKRGSGAIILCTPGKWRLIRSALQRQGLSAERLQRENRLFRLDVESFLQGLLVSGIPDPEGFNRQLDRAIAAIDPDCRSPDLRVWGEAVEVLRRRGQIEAAQALEEMWNRAIDRLDFSLLCSYNIHNLDPWVHDGAMRRLTDAHSRLIPEGDYRGLNEAVDRALIELYGADTAGAVWTKFYMREVDAARMPTGESILRFFSRHHPNHAPRLFERTRHYFTSLARFPYQHESAGPT